MNSSKFTLSSVINTTVIVSALGYFVDIYDLLLFSIVRVASLKSLGVPDGELMNVGIHLINLQMMGMLIGGLVWGIIGDKKGRISVLFGSIFLYSIANIANGFVTNVEIYGVLRFLAGVGLAGELGAAITLVSEVLSKENRGYGTAIVASIGICGAVVAAIVGDAFTWQTAYIIGGCLGLILLVMRISMFESGMYSSIKNQDVKKGDLRILLRSGAQIHKYLSCILIGIPIWFVIGILVTFSPEIARELHATGPVVAGKSVMFAYIGLAIGDLLSGVASQFARSRKKIVFLFLMLTTLMTWIYLLNVGPSPEVIYLLCSALGFSTGYWAVFVTIASEQFGTNLRATVTTTAPNFVRGSVVPMTLGFQTLKEILGTVNSALVVGMICICIALVALWGLQETYAKDLNFIE